MVDIIPIIDGWIKPYTHIKADGNYITDDYDIYACKTEDADIFEDCFPVDVITEDMLKDYYDFDFMLREFPYLPEKEREQFAIKAFKGGAHSKEDIEYNIKENIYDQLKEHLNL